MILNHSYPLLDILLQAWVVFGTEGPCQILLLHKPEIAIDKYLANINEIAIRQGLLYLYLNHALTIL